VDRATPQGEKGGREKWIYLFLGREERRGILNYYPYKKKFRPFHTDKEEGGAFCPFFKEEKEKGTAASSAGEKKGKGGRKLKNMILTKSTGPANEQYTP